MALMSRGPSSSTRHPITGAKRFEENALHHFDFIGDRLIIRRYCSSAAGVRCLMNDGNPARVIHHRFDDATIARLLDLRWWNWDIDRITGKVRAIAGTDLAALEGD